MEKEEVVFIDKQATAVDRVVFTAPKAPYNGYKQSPDIEVPPFFCR